MNLSYTLASEGANGEKVIAYSTGAWMNGAGATCTYAVTDSVRSVKDCSFNMKVTAQATGENAEFYNDKIHSLKKYTLGDVSGPAEAGVYSSGTASAQVNNWKGSVSYNAQLLPTYDLSDGTSSRTGDLIESADENIEASALRLKQNPDLDQDSGPVKAVMSVIAK